MTYPPEQPPTAVPYGQPYPPPPMPPQPPKKNHTALIVILSVVGAVVALCLVGGVISAATSGNKPAGSNTQAAADNQAGAAATDDNSAAASPTKAKPSPTPKTLVKMSGNGTDKTKMFDVGDEWTITYTYDCRNWGQSGNFQVYEDYPEGDVLVNELGIKGTDSKTVYGSGTHYLEISSECDWTITVTG